MSDAEAPIAQSDLPARFAMGVLMIGVAIAVTMLGGWPFRALCAVAAAVMLVEWGDMHKVSRRWSVVGAALLAAALLGGAEYLFPIGSSDWVFDDTTGEVVAYFDADTLRPSWLGFSGIAALGLLLGLAIRRPVQGVGFVYIGVPAFALVSLAWVWEALVFWVFVVTWATDIFAYFAGRAIGGPKLAPTISPKKTWAGLLGGVAGAAACGWLLAVWFQMEPFFLWAGAAMGLIAQIGDLFESWVKRRAGVKDSGTLLPGHGGALDRLDGLLAVSLATTLLLMAGFWTA